MLRLRHASLVLYAAKITTLVTSLDVLQIYLLKFKLLAEIALARPTIMLFARLPPLLIFARAVLSHLVTRLVSLVLCVVRDFSDATSLAALPRTFLLL